VYPNAAQRVDPNHEASDSLRLRWSGLLLALVVAVSASGSSASVTLLGQERLVRVVMDGERWCTPENDPLCAYFPPVGPFSESAQDSATGFEAFDSSRSNPGASASQTSALSESIISASGAMNATGYSELVEGGTIQFLTTAATTAESRLSVTFQVDEPTPYRLDGTLEGWLTFFNDSQELRLQLDGPQGPVAQIPCIENSPGFPPAGCGPTTERHEGTLAPGIYTLVAVSEASGDPGELGGAPETAGSGSFEVTLSLGRAVAAPGLGSVARVWLALAIGLAAVATARARAPIPHH
jgi:hypothetical protein